MPPQTIESRVEKLEECQMSPLQGDLVAKISAMERTLLQEIHSGNERILTQMRVFHEEVISRLALIQEGQARRRRRRS